MHLGFHHADQPGQKSEVDLEIEAPQWPYITDMEVKCHSCYS